MDKFSLTRKTSNLPALLAEPERPELSLKVPIAVSAAFTLVTFLSSFSTSLLASWGILAVFMNLFGAVFFAVCSGASILLLLTALTIVTRELKYARTLEQFEQQALTAVGDLYNRYRVDLRHHQAKIQIRLLEYYPDENNQYRTKPNVPKYQAQVLEERNFSTEQEAQALEYMVELEEQAKELEYQSRNDFEKREELLQSAESMLGRLQEQLPKATA